MLLPAVAAIVRIMLQGVWKCEKVTAGFTFPLDLPRCASSLLLFPFRCELLLAILTVVRDVIPGRIIGEGLSATLAGLLETVRGFRRFRRRGWLLLFKPSFNFLYQVHLLSTPHTPVPELHPRFHPLPR